MPTVIAPLIVGAGASAAALNAATIGVSLALYPATIAASYFIQQAIAPKPETGTKLNAELGGAVPQSWIFGEKETAGSFIYTGIWGRSGKTPNAFLANVYCLQDLRSEGFTARFWTSKKNAINTGETWTLDGNNMGNPVPVFDDGSEHHLGVKYLDGTQTVADGYLRDKFGSADRPWTADMIGKGRTLAIVTQKYNKKEPEGEVQPLFVVKGVRLYDWRLDGTNGGTGSHRYGTYSTYEYTANPVVIIYNIMRGIYYGSDWFYGGQAWPAERFDNDSWTAAANVCDENVSLAAGGTEKRYRVGGEVETTEEPWTVIERLLKACSGRIVESGGVYKIYCGGIGASVFSFTDDDIITSEELTGKLFPARESIANTIGGTYVEPENAGAPKAFKSKVDADALEDDGDVRATSMDFEYVRSNTQAQRLARLALKDNRRFRTFTVAFWAHARKLEPCDVVSWTSTRFGFTSKKFIVGDVQLRDDGVVIVNLREADATDADWDTSNEDSYEVGVYGDIATTTQSLSATVTAVSIKDDDDNNRRPAIRIQATLDADFVDCQALRWQVRKGVSNTAIIARGRGLGFFDPDDADYGDMTVTDNSFMPGRTVQVRYKIDPESDRETAWSDWVSVTLTNARLRNEDLAAGAVKTDNLDGSAVTTPKVSPKTIEGRFGWADKKGKTQTWSNVTKPKKTDPENPHKLGGSTKIDNPNPAAVHLRLSFKASARVTAWTNLQDSGNIKMTTKLVVYSAPVNDEGAVQENKKKLVYKAELVGKVERNDGKTREKPAKKKVKNLLIMDLYKGEEGGAAMRKYWAEATFSLTDGGRGATVYSGTGYVKGVSVQGAHSKR